ncbi:MAG: TIGR01212 family radical SAM protein [Epulopiscium sp.]|nr:TIGR01212 family radical SAM protein [Candidatus Epulonipiscium sp.]
MRFQDKRYHSLNFYLRTHFQGKVAKISLDGGFTCPNRDGTLDTRGCIFCSESGSGDFAGCRTQSITEQFYEAKKQTDRKWTPIGYIAYFQAFTNTYASLPELQKKYNEALSLPGVVGLAIATRPDCLSDEIIQWLAELNKKTFLWIELGLQTIHEHSAKYIRRGYRTDCFYKTVQKLHQYSIATVCHLIFGLPGETKEDMLASVSAMAKLPLQGIKMHLLHVLKNTDLGRSYEKKPFSLLTQDEYIELIVDALELLPPKIVIHRMTGDGPKDLLLGPLWSLQKRATLNGIEKELKKRDSWQGKKQWIL